ncbi:DUF559 domain-containing protein [archaeon]|nr:DUF559 domain-containing protein [archaeon]
MEDSKENFGKILCEGCQEDYDEEYEDDYDERDDDKEVHYISKKKLKKSTSESRTLYFELIKRGIPAELEKWDGHKTIDIAIPKAKFNIEVDGRHHNTNSRQALADMKRTIYSLSKGYHTQRIPNISIIENLEETADWLAELIQERIDEPEEIFYD